MLYTLQHGNVPLLVPRYIGLLLTYNVHAVGGKKNERLHSLRDIESRSFGGSFNMVYSILSSLQGTLPYPTSPSDITTYVFALRGRRPRAPDSACPAQTYPLTCDEVERLQRVCVCNVCRQAL